MADDATFELGEPALVCRWRMAAKHVPLLNRHLRALAARRVSGEPLSRNLLSWVKQHIEWSLAEDAYAEVDGVLMLVIDTAGQAAMTVGAFEPLAETAPAALAARAAGGRAEAAATLVAPEVLCVATAEGLVVGLDPAAPACGALSLVEQLAQTHGFAVSRDAALLGAVQAGEDPYRDPHAAASSILMLVSDEHGVVVSSAAGDASDSPARELASFLASGYQRLLEHEHDGRRAGA